MTEIVNNEKWVFGRLSSRKVSTHGQTRRALVVDDNEHGAIATSALLGAGGFDTKTALGGLAAVELLEQWLPHVILLDISMPEFDGFAVASVVRSINSTSHVAMIAMTGFDEATLRAKGSLQAFDGFFQRGARERDLLTLIDDFLLT